MGGLFSPLLALLFISSADGAVLGACLALAIATLLFIFYIQPDASDLAPHRSKLDQLMERRDTIYDNLRDLRFEFRSGKYSEGDYEAMKTSLILCDAAFWDDFGTRRSVARHGEERHDWEGGRRSRSHFAAIAGRHAAGGQFQNGCAGAVYVRQSVGRCAADAGARGL